MHGAGLQNALSTTCCVEIHKGAVHKIPRRNFICSAPRRVFPRRWYVYSLALRYAPSGLALYIVLCNTYSAILYKTQCTLLGKKIVQATVTDMECATTKTCFLCLLVATFISQIVSYPTEGRHEEEKYTQPFQPGN